MPLTDIYSAASYIPEARSDLQIELYGSIEGWSDEISTGIVRHTILRRAGAIHQQPVLPPKKFTFRGVLLGQNVRTRYVQMADIFRAYPFGLLIHPRFSSIPVAVESMRADENPGEGIDCIDYSLACEESGLRDRPRPSPSALAQQSNSRADALVATAQRDFPSWVAQAQQVQTAARGFGAVLQQVSSSAGLLDLQASLAAVHTSVTALAASPQPLRSGATVIYGLEIDSYNRAIGARPSVVSRPIAAPILLPRLCADLYGAGQARAMAAEIRALNPFLPPLLPVGYPLLRPDPAAVRRGALSV